MQAAEMQQQAEAAAPLRQCANDGGGACASHMLYGAERLANATRCTPTRPRGTLDAA